MFIIKKKRQIYEKPKYGKVIAITAVTVAIIEALVIAGIVIAKKLSKKETDDHHDDDFIMIPDTEDCSVCFEETEEGSAE